MYIPLLVFLFFVLMIRRPPRSTRTDTLFPYTTLFRSLLVGELWRQYQVFADRPLASVQNERVLEVKMGDSFRSVLRRMRGIGRSEEHTSELQSLMRISYAVFCLKKKNNNHSYYTRRE